MSNTIKAAVKTINRIQAKTIAYSQVGSTIGKITDLSDVDSTYLDDGAMLVYNLNEEKFIIKNEVDNPSTKIIGGLY